MADTRPAVEIQAPDWSGKRGDRWLANIDRLESMIAPAGAALMAHAGFQPGERVVDVGCGGGLTTIEIAKSVALEGEALGIDISPVLIAEAERRARAAGVGNARFLAADAAVAHPEGAPFDRLASRFGSMFFADAPVAFANLHGMLQSGGRMDLLVWAPLRENPWRAAMVEVVGRHLDLPPFVPHAPGPFGLSDPDHVRSLLAQTGFTRVTLTPWHGEALVGGPGADAEAAADFVFTAMDFADLLSDQPAEIAERVRRDLVAEFARHHSPRGIGMGAKTWLVTAYAG